MKDFEVYGSSSTRSGSFVIVFSEILLDFTVDTDRKYEGKRSSRAKGQPAVLQIYGICQNTVGLNRLLILHGC